jgi:AbrB family looped-hinge helix DNA binding protein
MESAITVKGQATIPKAIREHLGLQPGDRVKFFVHPDGSVVCCQNSPLRRYVVWSNPGMPGL